MRNIKKGLVLGLIILGAPLLAFAAITSYTTHGGDTIAKVASKLNETPAEFVAAYPNAVLQRGQTFTSGIVTPPVVPPVAPGEIILNNVYTTGYANADNTPAGSNATNLGGHSGVTGGNGSYASPTTVAVGGSIIGGKEVDDFPYGTIFYVPNLRKYFVATDFCGDGNSPQNQPCHSLAQAPKGATLWIDLFVGGGSANEGNCESAMTGLNTVVENPPANLAVVTGDICTPSQVVQTQYGNAII